MKYSNLYMNYNQKKIYEKYANTEYKSNKKLKAKIVDNAIILPAKLDESDLPKLWAIGGVVDSNDNFVEESNSRYLFGGYYEFNYDYVNVIDEEVVFFGPFVKHWGHFICDQISRLWFILDNPKKYKIAYCGWNWYQGSSDLSDNYLELFKLLGIDENQLINVQNPTRFKKVIIPEFSFIPENFYSEEFEKLTETIVKNVNVNIKKYPDNIYYSRMKLNNSKDKEIGEDKIIKYFVKRNYKILSPEELTLSEQIFYLNHAKKICMTSGSISHNIMFCKNDNNIIILNKTDMINGYQMVIDHISKSKIIYIDIYKKIFSVLFGMGPFLLYVTKYLQQWGGKEKKSKGITLKDYKWYFNRYFEIYKNPNNKRLLKSQNMSMKKKKL